MWINAKITGDKIDIYTNHKGVTWRLKFYHMHFQSTFGINVITDYAFRPFVTLHETIGELYGCFETLREPSSIM